MILLHGGATRVMEVSDFPSYTVSFIDRPKITPAGIRVRLFVARVGRPDEDALEVHCRLHVLMLVALHGALAVTDCIRARASMRCVPRLPLPLYQDEHYRPFFAVAAKASPPEGVPILVDCGQASGHWRVMVEGERCYEMQGSAVTGWFVCWKRSIIYWKLAVNKKEWRARRAAARYGCYAF